MQIFSPKHKTCRNVSAWENISAGVSLLEEFQKVILWFTLCLKFLRDGKDFDSFSHSCEVHPLFGNSAPPTVRERLMPVVIEADIHEVDIVFALHEEELDDEIALAAVR